MINHKYLKTYYQPVGGGWLCIWLCLYVCNHFLCRK